MKKLIAATFALCVMFGLSGAASAQTRTPRINSRERNQQRRIYQGVRSGTLTPREAGRLESGAARIERRERRYRSDGRVTRSERRNLNKSLNRENRRIYKQKHDRRIGYSQY